MKKKYEIFVLFALIVAFSATMASNFKIKIFLDDKSVNVTPPNEINGDSNLSPLTINRGESSIFTWNYDYLTSLNLSGNGGFSTTDKSGFYSLSPNQTSNYTLNVDNGNNAAKIEKNYTINVIQPDPIINFNADKLKIGEGQSANLSWNVLNSDSATINNGIGSINLNDSLNVSPSNDTTYTLNAIGYFGEKTLSRALTIDVVKNSIINSFSVNKNNFTIGESATFSWNVTDTEGLELEPFGVVSNTSQNILLNNLGSFSYTLKSRSFNDSVQSSSPININVFGEPLISSYTVNSLKTVNVESGDDVNFAWNQTNGSIIRLDNNVVTGNATTLQAPSATKIYNLVVENGAGKTVQDSVSVNIIQPVAINTFTNPSNVFANAPFTMNWTGSNVEKYELTSTSGSGVSGTEDLVKATSKVITPTSSGTYTYTLKATNLAEKSTEQSRNVIVEADPAFTGFTVNGETSVTVAPSAALSFVGTGYSSGATLQGRNSGNTANATLPTTASSTAGTTTYYAVATKALNSVTRYSAPRTVTVTVVNAPTIGTITAPSNVFDNSTFTMSWSGTNVVNYKIRGNIAASGVSTTDVDLGTATTRSIIPTAPGSYTYTITATNAAGVTTTATKVVVAEDDPTFTGFTVNGETSINVSPSETLSFVGTGYSSGASLQGRNSGNTANATLPTTASSTAGTTTYYASAFKTVNSITKYSSARSVTVTVINAPTIGAITAPSNVFANSAFAMSWTGTNVTSYSIRGNVAASGVSTTDVDLGTATSRSITPTAAGSYTYTITATNAVGVTTTSTRTVVVEADPTFTGFTVNGGATDTVAPNSALSFVGTGYSSGATLQGRNSANTADANLPATASSSAGTTTYYAAATKTLNGIERVSSLRSVSVTVVNNPTIGTITAPSNVFANEAFTMSWSGSNVTSYSIRGNSASSGVSTSNVSLGTVTSRSITPTAAGTYTYTITATNAAGVTTTSTDTVIVETDPTFSSVTANGTALPASLTLTPNATLNFVSSGLSSGAADILFQDGNLRGMTGNAPATAGTYTYAYTAFKTLNGITHSAPSRSLTLTVANTTPTINSFVATSTYLTSCQNSRLAKFAFSYSNTTSLTLYPPAANGSAQSTSGAKNVTGLTSYTYPNDVPIGKYVYFTLKACNAGNCVSQTLVTSAYDDWGGGCGNG